jgi:hypothetical protein
VDPFWHTRTSQEVHFEIIKIQAGVGVMFPGMRITLYFKPLQQTKIQEQCILRVV